MKSREKDEKRNLSISELKAELRSTREKHFRMGFKHRVTPMENPMQLRTLRRHIARLETWIREKSAKAQTAGKPE